MAFNIGDTILVNSPDYPDYQDKEAVIDDILRDEDGEISEYPYMVILTHGGVYPFELAEHEMVAVDNSASFVPEDWS